MVKIMVWLIFFYLLSAIIPATLFSENDLEIEIIDENENTEEESQPIINDEANSSQNILEKFFQSGKGQMRTKYSWFFNALNVPSGADPEPDSQAHIIDQYLTYSFFLEEGLFRFDFSTYLALGNQKYMYSSRFQDINTWAISDVLQDSDNRRHYFDIDECYISLFFPACDFIIGKKIFTNSLSSIYSPADIYKAVDTHDPFDPRELGRIQAMTNMYAGDFTFSLIIWPYYQGGKEFGLLSRWGYYWALEEIAKGNMTSDMLTYDERIYPEIKFENMSCLMKMKGTLTGWDFFLTAFHGLAGNTVSHILTTIPVVIKEPEVVPVFQITGGFATTIGKLEFHAEAFYNYTYNYKDDHFIRYLCGLRYTIDELGGVMDRIEFTCEYAREDIFEKQNNSAYTDSTEGKRYYKNDIIALIRLQFTTRLKLNLLWQYTFSDTAFILSPNLDYQVLDNLSLMAGAQFLLASEGSSFYNWRDNSRLIAQITYDF
ncbi:MAG: hypothetical protein JW969_09985 [Spirochaetales bacterium]|nr:hypothetical protein [Spirochaetales bacterium]